MSKVVLTFEDDGMGVTVTPSFEGDGVVTTAAAMAAAIAMKHLEEGDGISNYARTAAWLDACGKNPGDGGQLSVQIGCDIEETCEFLRVLRTNKEGYAKLLERCISDLEWFAGKLKSGESLAYIEPNKRVEALDALCDREVTGNGVAFLAGFDKVSADIAVLESNDNKLVDGKPVLKEGGKIGKPDGWTPPDLTQFV